MAASRSVTPGSVVVAGAGALDHDLVLLDRDLDGPVARPVLGVHGIVRDGGVQPQAVALLAVVERRLERAVGRAAAAAGAAAAATRARAAGRLVVLVGRAVLGLGGVLAGGLGLGGLARGLLGGLGLVLGALALLLVEGRGDGRVVLGAEV